MSENIRLQTARKGLKDNVFQRLAKPGGDNATPDEAQKIASEMRLNPSATVSVAGFYDYLTPENREHRQWVCEGTACLVSGTCQNARKHSPDAGVAMCVGYCHAGGGMLRRDDDRGFSTGCVGESGFSAPDMPVYDYSGHGILTSDAADAQILYAPALAAPLAIVEQLKASQLRGRGGAGFEFAFKLAACAREQADRKYVVCNADEGDPGAFSDRYLLEKHPHKVMAGMYAAALAAGAEDCVLYIRKEYPESIAAVNAAIDEYRQWPDAFSGNIRFHVIEGAGSYVCGEETALLNSIEGLRPEVRVRPPWPAQYGLWGKPTIVSNVETFANIPWILQHGGDAYAGIGTDDSRGSKLISLNSLFVKPGLYEVDFGMPLEELIYQHAEGFTTQIKALQTGGPLGSIIPLSHIDGLIIDFDAFTRAGFALGHAGIIAIPQDYPIIELLRHLFRYMAHESCGKCTPCRLGTARGADMLEQADDQPVDLHLFHELLETLETGSLCALGGGLPLPARNCLTHFRAELAPWFSNTEHPS